MSQEEGGQIVSDISNLLVFTQKSCFNLYFTVVVTKHFTVAI